MSAARRERMFLVGSGVLLLAALVAGIWMLLRARAIFTEEESAAERTALLERRDDLRGQVAEVVSLNTLDALPREQPDRDAFRDALRDAARRYQEDPLDGNPDHAPFGCVGVQLSSPDEGLQVWTSGPLAASDRSWALLAISADGADRGTRRVLGDSRIMGLAWRAFIVDGEAHVGALLWMTPRVR